MCDLFEESPTFLRSPLKESNIMSVENANLQPNSPSRTHSIPILKNNEDVTRSKEKRITDEGSLHSYHLWLKEKQLRENDEKKAEC